MTYYNEQGQAAPESAWEVIDGIRVQVQNPAAIEQWRIDNGYIYTERPLPPPPPAPDTTDFDDACAKFRDICYIIRQAIGDPDFKGGFEEMTKLQEAPIYNTIQGLQLANAWSAVNDLCTYEGKKIGLGQPQWWYACWEQEAKDNDEPEQATLPNTNDTASPDVPVAEQQQQEEQPPTQNAQVVSEETTVQEEEQQEDPPAIVISDISTPSPVTRPPSEEGQIQMTAQDPADDDTHGSPEDDEPADVSQPVEISDAPVPEEDIVMENPEE